MKNARLSYVIQHIYDAYVTDKTKKELFTAKAKSMTESHIRVQCLIPKEVYAILASFGAFMNSESDFFTARSCEYIERRALEQGIMNTVLQTQSKGVR